MSWIGHFECHSDIIPHNWLLGKLNPIDVKHYFGHFKVHYFIKWNLRLTFLFRVTPSYRNYSPNIHHGSLFSTIKQLAPVVLFDLIKSIVDD